MNERVRRGSKTGEMVVCDLSRDSGECRYATVNIPVVTIIYRVLSVIADERSMAC